MSGRPGVVLIALLLIAIVTSVPLSTAAGQQRTISRTETLSLTPDEPGQIAVTVGFDVPGTLDTLSTRLPDGASVTDTTGFSGNGTVYQWQGETDHPSITFSVPANETGVARRETHTGTHQRVDQPDSGYTFVDAGSWALVRVPQLSTNWSWTGSGSVVLDSHVDIAGPGATGGTIAYLGPQRTYTRRVAGQTLHLVVPNGTTIAAGSGAVLDALAAAARDLDVGARDDSVFVVAAPTGFDWAAEGVEYGPADAWVRADASLDTPDNVWVHEYVHTRQAYEHTSETEWFSEASAEYYAAGLALRRGRIDYGAFASHLFQGTDPAYANGVLLRPDTWTLGTSYHKGALLLAALDYRIRRASGGAHSLDDVFRAMNDAPAPVTNQDFLAAVERVAGPETRRFADRYLTDRSTPDLPSKSQFERTFNVSPNASSLAPSGVVPAG